jgi:PAS domain S-box-containing protein
MKKCVTAVTLLLSQFAIAETDIFFFVRESDGSTNWQYIANYSSSLLIIALTYTVIRLFFSRRESQRYNFELEEIREQLEKRVNERTATLNESNILLTESNKALEDEISEHLSTTSQLRQSESYITEILHSMPLMLIGLNKDNQITQWNPKAEEVSGLKATNVLGKDLWKSYPEITVSADQIAQAHDKQTSVNIKYSQRGQYHFDITIYPLKDQSVTGVVLLIDDITQRVNSETMLIQKDKMSLMGEMASSMAHDINIPLKEMLKDVKEVRQSLAAEIYDEIELREILENGLIRGQQAKSVIDNLLDFSGSGGEAKTMADIRHIIDHSIELAEDMMSMTTGLRFQDIEVKYEYSEDLPKLPCYITELQQVFLSLVRHACSALGKVDDIDHVPTIRIAVTLLYDDIWIRFHHNGLAASNEEQKYMFEPIAEVDTNSIENPNSQRLSFSHFIITEQHQGQIAIISEKHETTFSIQLPTE